MDHAPSRAIVVLVVAGLLSCATKSITHPRDATPSSSASALPPLPSTEQIAFAPADAGQTTSTNDEPNVAIDSDLPEPGDKHTDRAPTCTWPLRSRTLIACASLYDTEERTDVAAQEKVHMFGILVVRGKAAALTAFETPPMRVFLDAWPDCEGDAPVAIEGNLELTGEPRWTPSTMIGGTFRSPYKLEHAKVLGPAVDVCKAVPGLPKANPFDRGAVGAALGAVRLDGCNAHADAGSESGHLRITFSPKGNVTRIELDAVPSGGEAVARCVRDRFFTVKIPPFDGGEITVGKSFVLSDGKSSL